MKLFDTTFTRLESALDVRLERQNVLNGNVANVDTPGYTPRELDFGKALAAAETQAPGIRMAAPTSEAPKAGHLSLGEPASAPHDASAFIKESKELQGGLDGNGVDLDKTMVELARNSLMYGAAARTVGKKMAILRYVASDGVG